MSNQQQKPAPAPKIVKKSARPSTLRKTMGIPVPASAQAVLAGLGAAGVCVWLESPMMTHETRTVAGWGIILSLVAWAWMYSRSKRGIAAASFFALSILFGGPLHLAAQSGYEGTVRALISRGLSVNAKSLLHGAAPLHLSSGAGQLAISSILLEHGADVNATIGTAWGGGGQETALHEASQEGKAQIVELLIENGIDLDARDQFGQTALHRAAFVGMQFIVYLLVESGCRTDIVDREGVVPAQLTPYEDIRELISAGPGKAAPGAGAENAGKAEGGKGFWGGIKGLRSAGQAMKKARADAGAAEAALAKATATAEEAAAAAAAAAAKAVVEAAKQAAEKKKKKK